METCLVSIIKTNGPLEDCMLSNFFLKKKIPCLLINIYKNNINIKASVAFHGNLWQT